MSFSTTSNRNRKGRFAYKDRAPLTRSERAAHRAAMAESQQKLREEQATRHAEFNASLRAILDSKAVTK